ncbi:hypothetical protein A9Q99_01645 [Gammaproteobacteria bacterium 45_16_T64]|nr:hypothetical protein A9Q99_01645 [Gammaproteobacteria bacterium 45_16_T64]
MIIPPHNMEIENIYSQLCSGPQCAISLTSANANEGVSSIAFALAQRNLLAGKSTLLVDLNLHHPSLNTQLCIDYEERTHSMLLAPPQLVSPGTRDTTITGITAPTSREAIIKLRRPGVLEGCISQWQEHFDYIIIDSSPINRVNSNNIPAERVAAACDGCILVVLASQTTETMVMEAAHKLNTAKASVLGCVYNDRDNPPINQELLREIDRLPNFLRGIADKLRLWVLQNRLLSLNV